MPFPEDAIDWVNARPRGDGASRDARAGIPDIDDDERERDLRHHASLSGAYPAGHELLVVANRPIRINSPGIFSKIRVLLRDVNRVAYIGVDRDVESAGIGNYDDILPGGNELEEYVERGRFLSILIDGVPSTPVEVYLYGGRFARPK